MQAKGECYAGERGAFVLFSGVLTTVTNTFNYRYKHF